MSNKKEQLNIQGHGDSEPITKENTVRNSIWDEDFVRKKLHKFKNARNAQLSKPKAHKNIVDSREIIDKRVSNIPEIQYESGSSAQVAFDKGDSRRMLTLANKLASSQRIDITDEQRQEWFEKQGYIISSNGVVMPKSDSLLGQNLNFRHSQSGEMDSLSSISSRDKIKSVAWDHFLSESDDDNENGIHLHDDEMPGILNMRKFRSKRRSFIRRGLRDITVDSGESDFEGLSSDEELSETENDESVLLQREMLPKLYPLQVAMKFLSTDFQCSNQLMDMECYGSFESTSRDGNDLDGIMSRNGDSSDTCRSPDDNLTMNKSANADIKSKSVQSEVVSYAPYGKQSLLQSGSLNLRKGENIDVMRDDRSSPNEKVRLCYSNLMASMLKTNSILLDNTDMEVYRENPECSLSASPMPKSNSDINKKCISKYSSSNGCNSPHSQWAMSDEFSCDCDANKDVIKVVFKQMDRLKGGALNANESSSQLKDMVSYTSQELETPKLGNMQDLQGAKQADFKTETSKHFGDLAVENLDTKTNRSFHFFKDQKTKDPSSINNQEGKQLDRSHANKVKPALITNDQDVECSGNFGDVLGDHSDLPRTYIEEKAQEIKRNGTEQIATKARNHDKREETCNLKCDKKISLLNSHHQVIIDLPNSVMSLKTNVIEEKEQCGLTGHPNDKQRDDYDLAGKGDSTHCKKTMNKNKCQLDRAIICSDEDRDKRVSYSNDVNARELPKGENDNIQVQAIQANGESQGRVNKNTHGDTYLPKGIDEDENITMTKKIIHHQKSRDLKQYGNQEDTADEKHALFTETQSVITIAKDKKSKPLHHCKAEPRAFDVPEIHESVKKELSAYTENTELLENNNKTGFFTEEKELVKRTSENFERNVETLPSSSPHEPIYPIEKIQEKMHAKLKHHYDYEPKSSSSSSSNEDGSLSYNSDTCDRIYKLPIQTDEHPKESLRLDSMESDDHVGETRDTSHETSSSNTGRLTTNHQPNHIALPTIESSKKTPPYEHMDTANTYSTTRRIEDKCLSDFTERATPDISAENTHVLVGASTTMTDMYIHVARQAANSVLGEPPRQVKCLAARRLANNCHDLNLESVSALEQDCVSYRDSECETPTDQAEEECTSSFRLAQKSSSSSPSDSSCMDDAALERYLYPSSTPSLSEVGIERYSTSRGSKMGEHIFDHGNLSRCPVPPPFRINDNKSSSRKSVAFNNPKSGQSPEDENGILSGAEVDHYNEAVSGNSCNNDDDGDVKELCDRVRDETAISTHKGGMYSKSRQHSTLDTVRDTCNDGGKTSSTRVQKSNQSVPHYTPDTLRESVPTNTPVRWESSRYVTFQDECSTSFAHEPEEPEEPVSYQCKNKDHRETKESFDDSPFNGAPYMNTLPVGRKMNQSLKKDDKPEIVKRDPEMERIREKFDLLQERKAFRTFVSSNDRPMINNTLRNSINHRISSLNDKIISNSPKKKVPKKKKNLRSISQIHRDIIDQSYAQKVVGNTAAIQTKLPTKKDEVQPNHNRSFEDCVTISKVPVATKASSVKRTPSQSALPVHTIPKRTNDNNPFLYSSAAFRNKSNNALGDTPADERLENCSANHTHVHDYFIGSPVDVLANGPLDLHMAAMSSSPPTIEGNVNQNFHKLGDGPKELKHELCNTRKSCLINSDTSKMAFQLPLSRFGGVCRSSRVPEYKTQPNSTGLKFCQSSSKTDQSADSPVSLCMMVKIGIKNEQDSLSGDIGVGSKNHEENAKRCTNETGECASYRTLINNAMTQVHNALMDEDFNYITRKGNTPISPELNPEPEAKHNNSIAVDSVHLSSPNSDEGGIERVGNSVPLKLKTKDVSFGCDDSAFGALGRFQDSLVQKNENKHNPENIKRVTFRGHNETKKLSSPSQEKDRSNNGIRPLKETLRSAKNCRIPIRRFVNKSSKKSQVVHLTDIHEIRITTGHEFSGENLACISFQEGKSANNFERHCIITTNESNSVAVCGEMVTLELNSSKISKEAKKGNNMYFKKSGESITQPLNQKNTAYATESIPKAVVGDISSPLGNSSTSESCELVKSSETITVTPCVETQPRAILNKNARRHTESHSGHSISTDKTPDKTASEKNKSLLADRKHLSPDCANRKGRVRANTAKVPVGKCPKNIPHKKITSPCDHSTRSGPNFKKISRPSSDETSNLTPTAGLLSKCEIFSPCSESDEHRCITSEVDAAISVEVGTYTVKDQEVPSTADENDESIFQSEQNHSTTKVFSDMICNEPIAVEKIEVCGLDNHLDGTNTDGPLNASNHHSPEEVKENCLQQGALENEHFRKNSEEPQYTDEMDATETENIEHNYPISGTIEFHNSEVDVISVKYSEGVKLVDAVQTGGDGEESSDTPDETYLQCIRDRAAMKLNDKSCSPSLKGEIDRTTSNFSEENSPLKDLQSHGNGRTVCETATDNDCILSTSGRSLCSGQSMQGVSTPSGQGDASNDHSGHDVIQRVRLSPNISATSPQYPGQRIDRQQPRSNVAEKFILTSVESNMTNYTREGQSVTPFATARVEVSDVDQPEPHTQCGTSDLRQNESLETRSAEIEKAPFSPKRKIHAATLDVDTVGSCMSPICNENLYSLNNQGLGSEGTLEQLDRAHSPEDRDGYRLRTRDESIADASFQEEISASCPGETLGDATYNTDTALVPCNQYRPNRVSRTDTVNETARKHWRFGNPDGWGKLTLAKNSNVHIDDFTKTNEEDEYGTDIEKDENEEEEGEEEDEEYIEKGIEEVDDEGQNGEGTASVDNQRTSGHLYETATKKGHSSVHLQEGSTLSGILTATQDKDTPNKSYSYCSSHQEDHDHVINPSATPSQRMYATESKNAQKMTEIQNNVQSPRDRCKENPEISRQVTSVPRPPSQNRTRNNCHEILPKSCKASKKQTHRVTNRSQREDSALPPLSKKQSGLPHRPNVKRYY